MPGGLVERAPDEVDLKAAYLIIKIHATRNIYVLGRAFRELYHIARKLRITDLRAKAFDGDFVRRRDDDRPLDDIFELANVARVIIAFEQIENVRQKIFADLAHVFLIVFANKMLRQRQNSAGLYQDAKLSF